MLSYLTGPGLTDSELGLRYCFSFLLPCALLPVVLHRQDPEKKTILSFRNFTGGGGGKELFYFVILFCFWYLTGSCSGRDGLTK